MKFCEIPSDSISVGNCLPVERAKVSENVPKCPKVSEKFAKPNFVILQGNCVNVFSPLQSSPLMKSQAMDNRRGEVMWSPAPGETYWKEWHVSLHTDRGGKQGGNSAGKGSDLPG